ncbi:MAG: GHKL domain-containing protein [Provencibacterium sp.]|jgi:hypothetical protein|nr:GHKL domain-containing protein [Provencibacterium sp.]
MRADRKRWLFAWGVPSFIALLLLLLFLAVSLPYPITGPIGSVRQITGWQLDDVPVSLPHSLQRVSARTPLTLSADFTPESGDYLYLKTVYTPCEVYADGELIFSYGQTGSYPAFLIDPPTKIALLPLPETGRKMTLTMRLLSPSQRNSLTLYPVLCGSANAIMERLFSEMWFTLFFSIILLAVGAILWLIAFALMRFDRAGISFFWLGLFALCVGVWSFGECNLSGLCIRSPSLLYTMAFMGMFTMPIPLLKFGVVVLGLHQAGPLQWTCRIMEAAVAIAILLQLTGTAAFSKTMYLFHLLIPISLCVFGGCILWESLLYKNAAARRFFLPVLVLFLFSLLEVANYYLWRLNVQKSFFFQLGVLAFLIIVSILCGYFMKDTFRLRVQNARLSYEIFLMEKQVEVQNRRYRLLSETSEQIRQQRHDLRHHIAVIQDFLENGETGELFSYLDTLSEKIPEEREQRLCENSAVNAVAVYYRQAALKAGIADCSIRLDIPEDIGRVPASELCVIIGNLLENATAACKGTEKPFIRMCSRTADGILTIALDNRFSFVKRGPDGSFLSSKPGGGIGLASIRSVAEKYGGGCRFEAKDGVFASSVYLRLTDS